MKINKGNTAQFLRLIRYGLVGFLGTALHTGVLIAFVELAQGDPVGGSVLGFLTALIVSYILNRSWTFRSADKGYRQFFIYTSVSLLGLGFNTTLMFLTVNVLSWHYLLGFCLVVLVVPLSNYFLNCIWTFRNHSG
ncbi:MAG: GtrA family protein [Clostridia bacterium]|jgi:putative flippase GtrA|nr:GtrA family protein [Clostridia bacterium]